MTTKLFYLASLLAVMSLFSQEPPKSQLVDGVAAVVNDKVITLAEVREACAPIEESLRSSVRDPKEYQERVRAARLDTLNKLVERELILQAFASFTDGSGKGVKVPEEWVDREVREIIQREYDGDHQKFVKTLQGQGGTMAAFRTAIRERIIIQFMREREVSSNIFVSPYKIEQYYSQNVEKFKVDDQVKLRLIFIKKTDTSRAAADAALVKLKSGQKFADVAREVSDDRLTKDRGGELGWAARKDLRPELAGAAFALKSGEPSGVIETSAGYYIVQVEEIRPAHQRSIAEVRDEVEKILRQQEQDRLHREWIERLKRKAHIRYY